MPTAEPTLPEKIVAIEVAMNASKVSHAFGGALALAYYAEPRSTIDVDLNVFLPPEDHVRVEEALIPLGLDGPADRTLLERDGWFRYRWGRNPIDVFYAYQDLHRAMQGGCRQVPFGDDRITILSPEHLMVCKALFDRAKDWIDIEQMIVVDPAITADEVLGWVREYVPESDSRLNRLTGLLA